jgi:acyl-CoA thioesterase-1
MVLRVLLCNWLFAALLVAGAAAQAPGPKVRIAVFGDSLSAGFHLKATDSFPAQLERSLKARGQAVEVINASVSGDTTSSALERLRWSLPERVDAVILELGANDALRGLNVDRAKSNLDKMITTIKATGAEVLLAGMIAPRNLGQGYTQEFDAIYQDLAKKHGVLLYPFFLDGVALNGNLNLGDGIHPNTKGVAEITKRILPSVEQLIDRVRARQARNAKG